PGAKEVGVELFSMSKSYNMPGWRMGFVCGNPRMIHALARIKSYLDYGAFQPIQIASIVALEGEQAAVKDIVELHRKRRDVLVDGLNKIGWCVPKPKGTMFVWAPIPESFRAMGSLEFSKLLINDCKVAVSPGIGFGEYGEGFVRFALVENEQRIRQALRGLKTLAARCRRGAQRVPSRHERDQDRPPRPRYSRQRCGQGPPDARRGDGGARGLPAPPASGGGRRHLAPSRRPRPRATAPRERRRARPRRSVRADRDRAGGR